MELKTTYDIDQLDENIALLRSLDLKVETYESVLKIIENIFSNILCQIIPINVNPIFRARINENGSFNNLEQLIFPKAEKLTKFGRLTKPHYPILYASQKGEIAIFEIQPRIDDTITLIEFGFRPQFKDLQSFEIGVREKFLKNIPHVTERDGEVKFSEKYREIVKRVDLFFSDEFAKNIKVEESYKYKITAAISELTFVKNQFAECILYPSIAYFMDGLNVGIKTDVFLEKYFVKRVTEFKVIAMNTNENYKRYDIRCEKMTTNIQKDGTICW